MLLLRVRELEALHYLWVQGDIQNTDFLRTTSRDGLTLGASTKDPKIKLKLLHLGLEEFSIVWLPLTPRIAPG